MPAARRSRDLVLPGALLALAGCGWLPPDTPPARPAPPSPDAPALHDWTITGHVLGPRALISDDDSAAFHDRKVTVTASGYASPWSGSCGDARRDRQPRTLAEIAAAHDLADPAGLGLAEPVVEYQMVCIVGRTPPLTIYVAGPSALTCWSGVCYRLAR